MAWHGGLLTLQTSILCAVGSRQYVMSDFKTYLAPEGFSWVLPALVNPSVCQVHGVLMPNFFPQKVSKTTGY